MKTQYMKYLIFVGDGMADYPVPELGGKTPLEYANTPNMDYIASHGICGTSLPTPPAMKPESDTANLALLGYDPLVYSRGRSPLEALSMGINMSDTDTAIRCNIVTLSEEDVPYAERRMIDHSAGEIDTPSARVLVDAVNKALGSDKRNFYCGLSYRHCLIWKDCPPTPDFARPHDIIGKTIGEYLPEDERFRSLMEKSHDVLEHHPLNEKRRSENKKPANSIWLWSAGKKPALPSFSERFGLRGAAVAAVDLIKGIAICAGMDVINVEGADGTPDTNYMGKANAALRALEKYDFVFLHVEAPDESGHRGEPLTKVRSIESVDAMLGSILEGLKKNGTHARVLFCCDHPTPVSRRTHTHDSIPFVIYDTKNELGGKCRCYSEKEAQKGVNVADGYKLIDILTEK